MESSVFYCQSKKGLEGNGWAFRKNTAQILWFSFDSKIDMVNSYKVTKRY